MANKKTITWAVLMNAVQNYGEAVATHARAKGMNARAIAKDAEDRECERIGEWLKRYVPDTCVLISDVRDILPLTYHDHDDVVDPQALLLSDLREYKQMRYAAGFTLADWLAALPVHYRVVVDAIMADLKKVPSTYGISFADWYNKLEPHYKRVVDVVVASEDEAQ